LALCSGCRDETYGSKEYRDNSAFIRQVASMGMAQGHPVICVICGTNITDVVTIEHIRPIGSGGTNSLDNLGPAHRRCNYGKH